MRARMTGTLRSRALLGENAPGGIRCRRAHGPAENKVLFAAAFLRFSGEKRENALEGFKISCTARWDRPLPMVSGKAGNPFTGFTGFLLVLRPERQAFTHKV